MDEWTPTLRRNLRKLVHDSLHDHVGKKRFNKGLHPAKTFHRAVDYLALVDVAD